MMKVITALPEGVKVENGAIIFDYSDADRIAGVFREYADTLNNGHKANGNGSVGKKPTTYACQECARVFPTYQGLGRHSAWAHPKRKRKVRR